MAYNLCANEKAEREFSGIFVSSLVRISFAGNPVQGGGYSRLVHVYSVLGFYFTILTRRYGSGCCFVLSWIEEWVKEVVMVSRFTF